MVSLATTMPLNPVHVALMRTGNVLVIAGSGNDPTNHMLMAGVFTPSDQTIDTLSIKWAREGLHRFPSRALCNGSALQLTHRGRATERGSPARARSWCLMPLLLLYLLAASITPKAKSR